MAEDTDTPKVLIIGFRGPAGYTAGVLCQRRDAWSRSLLQGIEPWRFQLTTTTEVEKLARRY